MEGLEGLEGEWFGGLGDGVGVLGCCRGVVIWGFLKYVVEFCCFVTVCLFWCLPVFCRVYNTNVVGACGDYVSSRGLVEL